MSLETEGADKAVDVYDMDTEYINQLFGIYDAHDVMIC